MTTAVSPRISYRVGRAPRLPFAMRRARLLSRLGVYALAWGVVGLGCWWAALGDGAAVAWLALAGLICGLLPKRRVRRPRTAVAPAHAHHSGWSAAASPAPAGGLAATGTGG